MYRRRPNDVAVPVPVLVILRVVAVVAMPTCDTRSCSLSISDNILACIFFGNNNETMTSCFLAVVMTLSCRRCTTQSKKMKPTHVKRNTDTTTRVGTHMPNWPDCTRSKTSPPWFLPCISSFLLSLTEVHGFVVLAVLVVLPFGSVVVVIAVAVVAFFVCHQLIELGQYVSFDVWHRHVMI